MKKKEDTRGSFRGGVARIRVAVSGGARNRLSAGSIEEGGCSPTRLEGSDGMVELQRRTRRGGRSEEGDDEKREW